MATDLCAGCGSDSLFSGWFDADDLGVDGYDPEAGTRWTTFCQDCGDEWFPKGRKATAKQVLVEHLNERHSRAKKVRPGPRLVGQWSERDTLVVLQRWHSREHHRYQTDHFHTFDGEGALVGPGTTERRPSGWRTGLKAVMRNG